MVDLLTNQPTLYCWFINFWRGQFLWIVNFLKVYGNVTSLIYLHGEMYFLYNKIRYVKDPHSQGKLTPSSILMICIRSLAFLRLSLSRLWLDSSERESGESETLRINRSFMFNVAKGNDSYAM